jgi:hypothetical protein
MAMKKRKKKWRGKLLLLSVLCGVLYFVDQRYDFFRLRSLEILPGGILPEAPIWESLPRRAEYFWPALFFESRDFVRKVEGFYPVELTLKLTGWGRYRVTVRPLEVFLNVSWNGRMWLLSTNGRMWLANLRANTIVKGIEMPDKPILSWDSGLPLPIDPERQGGDIYSSSLVMDKIRMWYETIGKTKWYRNIYCLLAKKVDGKPVVQVLFGTEDAITGEIVLKEDTSNWLSIAAAMEEIFPNAEYRMPPGMIVNATYTDLKFTVTNKGAKSAPQ